MMGKSLQVDAIYTDFAKAFDRVNHQLLINKLNMYGIGGKLLTWIKSYLTKRFDLAQTYPDLSMLHPVSRKAASWVHCSLQFLSTTFVTSSKTAVSSSTQTM